MAVEREGEKNGVVEGDDDLRREERMVAIAY